MRYLLIEEKAWREITAHAERMNRRMLELMRHFNPAGGTG